MTTEFTQIDEGLYITGEVKRKNSFEMPEKNLLAMSETTGELETDPLLDDYSLAINTHEGIVLLLGCAHAGLDNIMSHVTEKLNIDRIYAVTGGTHLADAGTMRIEKTIENLLVEIRAKGNVESLNNQLKGIAPFDWLNRIFKLIIEVEKDKLLAEHAVVPDQKGLLRKSTELNYDENIPAELKDVIVLLGKDYRSILVDKSVIRLPQLTALNVKNISESINDKIKEIKDGT